MNLDTPGHRARIAKEQVRLKSKHHAALYAKAHTAEMLEYLYEKVFKNEEVDNHGRPLVTGKEKTGVAQLFLRLTAEQKQVESSLGLSKFDAKQESPTVQLLVNGNVSFAGLPGAQRREAVMKMLGIDSAEKVKTLPAGDA